MIIQGVAVLKNKLKRSVAFALAMVFLSVGTSFSTYADNFSDKSVTNTESNVYDDGTYQEYSASLSDFYIGTEEILISSGKIEKSEIGDVFAEDILVAQDGLYEFTLVYRALGTQDVTLGLKIDGVSPFSESETLVFPAYWKNINEDWKEQKGNQFTPEQTLYEEYVTVNARDYSGQYETNYRFLLTAGQHSVSVEVKSGSFDVKKMGFTPIEILTDYKESENPENNAKPIIIEGENASLKNDKSLIPLSDNSSPLVHPSEVENSRLNYIGGNNWSSPGQTIYWDFIVEKDGYYNIGFNYRQNYNVGGISYRSLMIDGKSPFAESARIEFFYSASWKHTVYSSDNGDPYYFYLSKGEHQLSLMCTGGELCEVYSLLKQTTALIGDVYVDITKVVGETVDIYRSYELFNQVPNFNQRLEDIISRLENISDKMLQLQENKTSASVSTVNDAVRVISQMIDKPYSAHKYKSQFYSSYTNLSSLLSDMVEMPLDIDRIVLNGYNSDDVYDSKDVSFFEKIQFSLERFLITFTDDYDSISVADSDEEALVLWINWGRDQAQALNSIIQDSFVTEYKIPVSMKLVNASLINAILAGSGPDVLIQMSRTEPVNLAMRGALVDLSEFDDFKEVEKRFHTGATVPYTYKNGVYALPVTQGFFMMFMRTDILNGLGIEIPETWDEYIAACAVLQRNNLQAVLPYTQLAGSGTVNEGVGALTLYPTMLLQKGLSLYNENKTASTLSEIDQIQTFVEWTDLYTKYKFQEITNFYNRFRIGSAPLGIASYTLYTELVSTAPEIEGRWTVSVIPGTVGDDGTVNHTSAGWGAGCAITKLSKNPENAWKFLKWWTSADIQLKYSNTLESVLGPLGRVATANVEALSEMDWNAVMYEQIINQYNETSEIEELPGSYYTARGIDQAFWNVTEAGKDPTEMIKKWGNVVDDEIERKRAEYEE